MSLRTKQRIVAAAVIGLAVWPLAHRVLVARYRVTPWRLFGWAMYCSPKLPVRVTIQGVSGGERTRLAITDAGNHALRRAIVGFSRRRGVWGALVEPDGIGALALAKHPQTEAVDVEVEHLYLDPATALIASQRYTYTYTRQP